jgi:carbon storage regulator
MLVLSRKKNESIMIGDDIEITITAIEGDLVRIGIKAPKLVSIYRKELFLSIQEENRLAAQARMDWNALKDLLPKIPE